MNFKISYNSISPSRICISSMLLDRHPFPNIRQHIVIYIKHNNSGYFQALRTIIAIIPSSITNNFAPRIKNNGVPITLSFFVMFTILCSSNDPTLILDGSSFQERMPVSFTRRCRKVWNPIRKGPLLR